MSHFFDVRRFWEFFKETLLALIIAFVVFVGGIIVAGIEFDDERSLYSSRIGLYQAFQRDVLGSDFEESSFSQERFAVYARMFFEEDESSQYRARLFLVLADEEFQYEYTIFLGLDDGTIHQLLFERETIPDLIQNEERLYESVSMNWFLGWSWAVTSWQIVSVICILVFWWRGSYLMSYFPVRQWWFWGYGYLAFPWSLAIAFVLGLSLLLKGISLRKRYRNRDAYRSFEEHCSSLMGSLSETREKWKNLFPVTYAKAKIPELQKKHRALREWLKELGGQMEETERAYSHVQTQLEYLKTQSNNGNRDIEVWQQEWERELDQVLENPKVKAVHIVTRTDQDYQEVMETIEIFTSVLSTFWGNFGPLRISIPVNDFSSFAARLAYPKASRGHPAMGSSDFCFGENHRTISRLLQEGKVGDAVGVMMTAFEASATEI